MKTDKPASASTRALIIRIQNKLEKDFGFRPTVEQVIDYLIAKEVKSYEEASIERYRSPLAGAS